MSNETLPPSLLPLLHRTEQLPPLFPKKAWNPSLTDDIDHMKDSPPAVRAALHLLNDDIDRAHGIAQADEESMTSNLVHAILHRREMDFWNSGWWLNRISHPFMAEHYGGAQGGRKAARAFVDACEAVTKGASSACGAKRLEELKHRQWQELSGLVRWALENEGPAARS